MSVFVDWDQLVWKDAESSVLDTSTPTLENLNVVVRKLEAGESWTPEKQGAEGFIILKDGQLELSIDGASQQATPRSLVFLSTNAVVTAKNTGTVTAVFYVTRFTTAATATATAPGDGDLASTVIRWEDVEAQPQPLTDQLKVAWFKEKRAFLTLEHSATSPRLNAHSTTIDPGSGLSIHRPHRWVVLFFMLEGALKFYDYDAADETHIAKEGTFFYMAEEAPHSQIPVGDGPTSYFVVHISSDKTPTVAPTA